MLVLLCYSYLMTNTETRPTYLAHHFVNSACKFGFKMARTGTPRLQFNEGLVELHVLDPEGAVRLTVNRWQERAGRGVPAFLVETGAVEVTNLTVAQFEGILLGLLQSVSPV